MGIKQNVVALGANLLLERPVRGKSYRDIRAELEQAGLKISARLHEKKTSDFNHRVLTHIIGIERWGQSRLRVFLGEPLQQDEYTGYRPARDVPWHELVDLFIATRSETLSLTLALETAAIAPEQTVLHNGYGPLSARAWLRYLQTHASREILQVR